jgi:hypothetical protein
MANLASVWGSLLNEWSWEGVLLSNLTYYLFLTPLFFFTLQAILESTMIKNLDTGEVMPLSAAEERIPRGHGWSPLSEHLLRRTNQIPM